MRIANFEYAWEPFRISLTRPVAWDDAAADATVHNLAALEVFQALRPVFRPAVVDLTLACRYRDIPEMLLGSRPPIPRLRLTRNGGPDYLEALIPPQASYVSSTTLDINDSSLRKWMTAALQQTPEDADSLITLDQLSCWHGAARFASSVNEAEGPYRGQLQDGTGTDAEVALTDFEGELWVSAPGPEHRGTPPLTVEVFLEDERLVANLRAAWIPWADPLTDQHGHLLHALEGLTAKGWLTSD